MTTTTATTLKQNTIIALIDYLKGTLRFNKIIPIYSITKKREYLGVKVLGDFTIQHLDALNEFMDWEFHIKMKVKPLDHTPYQKGVILYV